jgi:LmbE family N-acetylglucosaminyl deacetylase
MYSNKGTKKKIIVFAPHPDDETIGCGGTIAKKIDDGYEVIVVVLTDGRNAFSTVLGIDINPTPEELKEIRKNEFIKATKILGVTENNLIFLNYKDGSLINNEMEVEEKIIEILKIFIPSEVYFTYEKDANQDHQATNIIIRNAIKKTDASICKYKYSINHTYSNIGPIIDSYLNIVKKNQIQVDISEYLDLKKAAINEYKSQITIISSIQKNTILSTQEMIRHLNEREVFYTEV